MQITHIDHVTALITDIAKARWFYGEVLGLKEIAAPKAFDFIALWYDLNGQYLHLLLKPVPDSISPRHFCLHVPDIKIARSHFAKHGIATAETVKIPSCDRFFVNDPDGNRIEILNWERPYNSSIDGEKKV